MVIDTSALLAVLFAEPDRDEIVHLIANAATKLLSAVSALEGAIVTEARKGEAGLRELDLLIHMAQVEVVPLDREQVMLAREAYHRFGKGRHPAGLNLGDCCAYALAMHAGEPLLFKGNDFVRTDVPDARH